ncbi:glycosyltransferase family 4 protein [Shimia biformata]|uniref:glycosyltransferase family 4 protein n=1 Tax=Shimia biformata TaxID=1294299 RepID=UPI001950BBC4|nr:glycosyltransferase family 1 protein [Shimia biformata]
MSRVGRVLTGVDRVELAYLRAVSDSTIPCFGLVRTRLGFVLLDQSGMASIRARFDGGATWGNADLLARATIRDRNRQRAESDLRRLCIARCRPNGLSRMLRRHVPRGASYLNVGHSNLTDRVLFAMRHGLDARIGVKLHDTIPLDTPQYQREGTDIAFRAMLRRVERFADVVICNSKVTRNSVLNHMSNPPEIVVAHLGVEVDCFDFADSDVVAGLPDRFFLSLGTIEPRKNHAFLFRVWEELATELAPQDMPCLVICGKRGWRNEAVFDWLDTAPLSARFVREYPDLTDPQIGFVMSRAAALLFPSHAEGFGLPPVEAALVGLPVISNTLESVRETLDDIPVYVDVSDVYAWKKAIIGHLNRDPAHAGRGQEQDGRLASMTWDAHFNSVLKVL